MKKLLCLLLCGVLLGTLCGCNVILDLTVGPSLVAEQEAIPRLGFSRGELFDEKEEILYLTVEEFDAQPIDYDAYRSSVCYDTLSENEQVLYRAYEYAMENGYNNLLVDDLLIERQESLRTVLEFLSLDSPLLEQNVRFSYGDFTSYYPVVGLNGLYETQAALDGYYVTVENFEAAYWSQKLEALDKAKTLVDGLPDGATPTEKALSLYAFVSEQVAYDEERYPELDDAVYPHLYDALVAQKTQCDGKANALALLYRLAGIPCVEKMHRPEAELGHTWVLFELDGRWYNADATASGGTNPVTPHMEGGYFFAYPDELSLYPTEYQAVYPVAADGLHVTVDARLESVDDDALYRAALPALNQHHREWFLAVIERYDEEEATAQLQRLVNYYLCSSHYYTYDLANGKTAFLACLYDE